jgi:hypothetical protein
MPRRDVGREEDGVELEPADERQRRFDRAGFAAALTRSAGAIIY